VFSQLLGTPHVAGAHPGMLDAAVGPIEAVVGAKGFSSADLRVGF
jgi:hypothetical protein